MSCPERLEGLEYGVESREECLSLSLIGNQVVVDDFAEGWLLSYGLEELTVLSGHVCAHCDEELGLVLDAEHVVEELEQCALAGAGADAFRDDSGPVTAFVCDAVGEALVFGASAAGEHGPDVAVEDRWVTVLKQDGEDLVHLGECACAFFQDREEVELTTGRSVVHVDCVEEECDEVAGFGFYHGRNEVEGVLVSGAGERGVAFDRAKVGEVWRGRARAGAAGVIPVVVVCHGLPVPQG